MTRQSSMSVFATTLKSTRDTVLAHLENLKSLTNSVSRVRQTLDENSGPRNTSNNVAW